jgi:hypothetical protein
MSHPIRQPWAANGLWGTEPPRQNMVDTLPLGDYEPPHWTTMRQPNTEPQSHHVVVPRHLGIISHPSQQTSLSSQQPMVRVYSMVPWFRNFPNVALDLLCGTLYSTIDMYFSKFWTEHDRILILTSTRFKTKWNDFWLNSWKYLTSKFIQKSITICLIL